MSFIGITGYERAGKDTVALLLKEHLGPNTNLIALADPIRQLAEQINPYLEVKNVNEHLPSFLNLCTIPQGLEPYSGVPVQLSYMLERYGWEGSKDRFPSVRTFMQKLSGCRGIFGDDCYVNVAKKTIASSWFISIVKDVRYDNEGRWCHKDSFALIDVARPGFGPVNGHESASGQAKKYADVLVQNDGTIDDMRPQIKAIADNLMQSFGVHYRNKRRPLDEYYIQLC